MMKRPQLIIDVGDEIQHEKFGRGKVLAVVPTAASVRFELDEFGGVPEEAEHAVLSVSTDWRHRITSVNGTATAAEPKPSKVKKPRKPKAETADVRIEFPAPLPHEVDFCEKGFADLVSRADGVVGSRLLRDGVTWTAVVEFGEPVDAIRFAYEFQVVTGRLKPVVH